VKPTPEQVKEALQRAHDIEAGADPEYLHGAPAPDRFNLVVLAAELQSIRAPAELLAHLINSGKSAGALKLLEEALEWTPELEAEVIWEELDDYEQREKVAELIARQVMALMGVVQ
jgi:hypothetical protein